MPACQETRKQGEYNQENSTSLHLGRVLTIHQKREWEIKFLTALIFLALSAEIIYLLLKGKVPFLPEEHGIARGTVQAVGSSLLRDYLIPFEVASLLLLVAMIGAIMLSRKKV